MWTNSPTSEAGSHLRTSIHNYNSRLASSPAVLLASKWYICDVPRSAPDTSTPRSISLLGRWSTSGSDRGIAHFFTATRNTIKGAGGKRTNEQHEPGVNSKCKTRSYATLCIPVSIYRLTLAWVSSENSTTHEESWLILTRLSPLLWTSSHPAGLSAVRCRLVNRVTLRQMPSPSPLVQLPSRVPLPTSGHVEISSPKPFVLFRAKTDKGIVCLVDHLHSVTHPYSSIDTTAAWKKLRFILSVRFDLKTFKNYSSNVFLLFRMKKTTTTHENGHFRKIVSFVDFRRGGGYLSFPSFFLFCQYLSNLSFF